MDSWLAITHTEKAKLTSFEMHHKVIICDKVGIILPHYRKEPRILMRHHPRTCALLGDGEIWAQQVKSWWKPWTALHRPVMSTWVQVQLPTAGSVISIAVILPFPGITLLPIKGQSFSWNFCWSPHTRGQETCSLEKNKKNPSSFFPSTCEAVGMLVCNYVTVFTGLWLSQLWEHVNTDKRPKLASICW